MRLTAAATNTPFKGSTGAAARASLPGDPLGPTPLPEGGSLGQSNRASSCVAIQSRIPNVLASVAEGVNAQSRVSNVQSSVQNVQNAQPPATPAATLRSAVDPPPTPAGHGGGD